MDRIHPVPCWSASSGNTNEHSSQSFLHILDKMEIFRCPGPAGWCRWCYSLKWCCHLVRERLKATFIFVPRKYAQCLEVRNGQGWELDICSLSQTSSLDTEWTGQAIMSRNLEFLRASSALGQQNIPIALGQSEPRELAFQVEMKAQEPQAVHAKSWWIHLPFF